MFLTHAVLLLQVGGGVGVVPSSIEGDWSWDTARTLDVRTSAGGDRYVADELLITLEHHSDRTDCIPALEARGAQVIGEVASVRLLRVLLPTGEDPLDVAAQYAALPGVRWAETNGIGDGGCTNAPNDTSFVHQWHLSNTGQFGGTPGADIAALGAWNEAHYTEPVVIAILDSGIDFAHPEFLGRTIPGRDFVHEDNDSTADHPHGIWVAGLAAANSGNGFQVAGVDANCKIVPLKVLNANNQGTTQDLIQAVAYCAQKRFDVVSMSLINYPVSGALDLALRNAREAGCILVACAGNGGIGNADVSGPGRSPQTISIGATDSRDQRAWYSGTGSRLDFVAPGDGVFTVSLNHNDVFPDWFGGCSAATPVAAGIVAMLKGHEPALTQSKAYQLLKIGAEDRVGPISEDSLGRDNYFGWGRLNAWRSLTALAPCEPPSSYGTGKMSSLGARPVVGALGTPRRSWNDFSVAVDGGIPGELAVLFYGSEPGLEPWQGGTLLVRTPLVHLRPHVLDAQGHTTYAIPIVESMVGTRRYFQAWFRDPGQSDGTDVGITDALDVQFCP